MNGVANYSNLAITTAAEDYYFSASTPSVSGISTGISSVFDVAQAMIRFEAVIPDVLVGQNFGLQASIRKGTSVGAPIDAQADGIGIRLGLYRCPGYPASCSVTIVNSNFANVVTTDGMATFTGLSISPANTDFYFNATTPSASGIFSNVSSVFDVLNPASSTVTFTLQGRPAPPSTLLAVPVHVVLTPTSGTGGTVDTTLTANNQGQVTISSLLPGTYDVWIKGDFSLAVKQVGVNVPVGASTLVMGQMLSGDADNSNTVTITDFAILAATFGKTSTQVGYDARADFNGDNAVTIIDFSILAASFGQAGAAP